MRATFRAPANECAPLCLCWRPGGFHPRCMETVIRREPCGPTCHPDWTDHDYLWRAKRSAQSAGGKAWRAFDDHPRCAARPL